MKPKLCNIILKGCLILAIVLSARSTKDDDTYESISIDSGSPDSGGLEDRIYYEHEGPELKLGGNLRKTMAYHVMLKDTSKSWVSSPLGALLPLGKLAIGSSSRRYTELQDAIGYKRRKVKRRFKEIMDHITHVSGRLVLVIASRMYVNHKESIRSKFNHGVREVFKSGCEKVDFGDPRGTASKINHWVNYETNGKIRNIIHPNEISRSSSLIIINAIYFRGTWKYSFDSVRRGTFYGAGQTKEMKMMTVKAKFNYFKSTSLKAQIVEIPYTGKDASLLIFLPNDRHGLPALIKQLANYPGGLNDYFYQMKKTNMKLTIPQFRVFSDLSMDNIYKKVGLKEIFKPDNKVLTKIVRGHTVYVTRSHQAAIFEVDESGSDGGVVDTIHLDTSQQKKDSSHRDIVEFKANHPFMFFVAIKSEQLFAGSYVG